MSGFISANMMSVHSDWMAQTQYALFACCTGRQTEIGASVQLSCFCAAGRAIPAYTPRLVSQAKKAKISTYQKSPPLAHTWHGHSSSSVSPLCCLSLSLSIYHVHTNSSHVLTHIHTHTPTHIYVFVYLCIFHVRRLKSAAYFCGRPANAFGFWYLQLATEKTSNMPCGPKYWRL